MAQKRQLARPPIKEALIDIQLAQPIAEQFEQLGSLSIPGYAKRLPVRRQEFSVQFADLPQMTSATDELFGWRYVSDDGFKILQFRRNGVGFSFIPRLGREYTNWNDIKSSTQHFWNVFIETVGQSVVVNRLATRYINVVEVPLANLDFEHYLTVPPRIPEPLPQSLQRFLLRLEVPFRPHVLGIIIQTLDTPTPTHLPLVLDIDVQMHKEFQGDSPDIWTELDALRNIKNDIFFSFVTERALEPYQ